MKKIMVAVASAVLILTMTAIPGKADTTHLSLLMGTSLYDFDLQGTGTSTILFNVRTCGVGGCIVGSGSASGTDGASVYTSGTYSFNSAVVTPLTLTPRADGSYAVNQTAPITFTYSSPQGDLIGTLTLASVAMVASPPGPANTATATGTLILTGGSLLGAVNDANSIPTTLSFALGGDISTLVNSRAALTGQIEYPSTMIPAPEPTSMLLLGSGLIAVGGAMRRRGRSLIS